MISKSCIDDPTGAFIEIAIIHLKDPQIYVSDILKNLDIAKNVYEANKPNTSLSDISNDLVDCLEPKLSKDSTIVGESIGFALVLIIIITAIFIFLITTIILVLKNNDNNELILGIIFFILIMYVIICILIIYHYSLTISNELNTIKSDVKDCIHNAANELAVFELTQQDAINKALCTYVALSPPINTK